MFIQNTDYNQAYAAANPAQRQAIDETEGTVLVVAGPGTGKTQIIGARIARIIQQGCQPENILCLTYTDAGTIAMRNRLLSFIGADAYRINIFTFHAFCNLVIQENPSQFGFIDLQPVSELEKRAFIKRLLDALPADNPLAKEKGDLYADTKGLLDLYAVMKREDWESAAIITAVDAHLEKLPDDPAMRYLRKTTRDGITYKPGDLKQHAVEAEIKKYERLKAAVLGFDAYQEILLGSRRYDFDDMILWVINHFKNSPELLCEYQERFHYVLVDEYQDTSGSQNEVVDLLMSYWDNPNLFVVGDDDQSIYRFQGASITNILSFQSRYQPRVVTLVDNYRSSQQILDAAQSLIRKNRHRLANSDVCPNLTVEKFLRANSPDSERPEIRRYPNILQEALGVALEIENKYLAGEDVSKIAILYRNNRQAEQLVRYLAAKGVPFNTRKREDVLPAPLIKQLVNILRYIKAEATQPHSEERLLFEILHYPVFELSPLAIARLFAFNRHDHLKEERTPMRERLQTAGDALFQSASGLIESTLANIVKITLQELVHDVINRFGLLKHSSQTAATLWNLELLNTFFDFVKDECARNPRLGLEQLLEMLDIMETQRIELPAERIACNQNGVNLITCHSSKGLEFDSVYLIGCNESEWEKKRSPVSFVSPPNMITGQQSDEDSNIEELRRLFFVAMTRAKRSLVISYADKDNNNKPLAKSRFVAELELTATAENRAYTLEETELEGALLSLMQASAPGKEDIFHSDFVGELLNEYMLSVTHLNNYLKCPHAFFYTHILRIPKPRNAAMAFGTSVHESLEYLFVSMQKAPDKAFPAKSVFIDFFRKEMNKRQESFTEVEFERRLRKGVQTLAKLYEQHVDSWHKEVKIEKSFKVLWKDGIRLNGLVDKLEILYGNSVNLVDYKTGRYDKKKFQPPSPEKVEKAAKEGREAKHEDLYGGDYWRQAVFYKIMVEKSAETSYSVASTEFCFVEPDETSGCFINHKVEIGSEDEDIVKEQIAAVYRKIMNREFSQGCNDKYCEWCRK